MYFARLSNYGANFLLMSVIYEHSYANFPHTHTQTYIRY